MTQSAIANPNRTPCSKFVSCIRINGVPILPPLITAEKRKEIRRYKREALKVEKRLEHQRELKDYISGLYKTTINDDSLNQGVQIADTAEPVDVQNTLSACAISTAKAGAEHSFAFNVQATQYVNNEFAIFVSDGCKSPIFLLDDLCIEGGAAGTANRGVATETSLNTPRTTPKLIRSNSYTLDSPSPALVNHWRASRGSVDAALCTTKACWAIDGSQTGSQSHGSGSISIGTDLEVTVIKDFASEMYLNSEDCLDSSRTETELVSLSDTNSHLITEEFTADNHRLASVDGDRNTQDSICQRSESIDLSDDGKTGWNLLLKGLPSAYSRRVLELLEHYEPHNSFNELLSAPEKYSTPKETANTTTQAADTMYYSANAAEQQGDETLCSALQLTAVQTEERKKLVCPKLDILSREQAATVLAAAARGFLVRRIMKTEKVQHLVQTIKDAVLCAMQLHHDTLDYIEEADVELHRRLIQQVSAACHSFHSVFFATSIQDQMALIAVDRQKKADKFLKISHFGASTGSDKPAGADLHLPRSHYKSWALSRRS